MRTIPLVAIAFAALSLSAIGARTHGTWCAQYSVQGEQVTAVSTHSNNAKLPCQGSADFACAIHSHPLLPNREGDIDAEKQRTVRFQGIEPPSVVMVESGVPRYARTYNPDQTVHMQ
jgi:hypothetical protein